MKIHDAPVKCFSVCKVLNGSLFNLLYTYINIFCYLDSLPHSALLFCLHLVVFSHSEYPDFGSKV